MKIVVYIVVAALLPFLGSFQESKVFEKGHVVFSSASYSQIPAAWLLSFLAMVLAVAAWRAKRGRARGAWHLIAAIFAVPALWDRWSMSRFGSSEVYTEITAGVGGPHRYMLFYSAAAVFIAADIFWARRATAEQGAPAQRP